VSKDACVTVIDPARLLPRERDCGSPAALGERNLFHWTPAHALVIEPRCAALRAFIPAEANGDKELARGRLSNPRLRRNRSSPRQRVYAAAGHPHARRAALRNAGGARAVRRLLHQPLRRQAAGGRGLHRNDQQLHTRTCRAEVEVRFPTLIAAA